MDPRRRDLLINYVLSRKCGQGGFCFYHLDEPNSSDTYYALSILRKLNVPFHDEKTMEFLSRPGQTGGEHESIHKAYYALKSIRIMGQDLPDSVIPFFLRHIHKFSFSPDRLPPEITSMFKRLRYLLELTALLKIRIEEDIARKMILFVLSFQNEDHGFGYVKSSLSDTVEALLILMQLGYPVESLGTDHFIGICENDNNGFTDVPRTSLSYIENIHDGLLSSAIIGYTPHHIDQCLDFVQSCQNRTGGYSRKSCTGIATLEYSYYAVCSLHYINCRNKIRKNPLNWV